MDNIENVRSFTLSSQIDSATSKIAPLWPLSHFVAVNPFVGFADHNFAYTAEVHKRVQGSDLVMPITWFKEKFESGYVRLENLRFAVAVAAPEVVESFKSADQELSAENVVALLSSYEKGANLLNQTCSFSAYLDLRGDTQWQHVIREEVAKWVAAYDDEGQSSWKFPWKNLSLFEGWKAAAQIDRNPELNGLTGFRKFVASLPDNPHALIDQAVETLLIPEERVESLFYRIMLTLPGWAGHLRYKDRELEIRGESGDSLIQLLAILLSYDMALYANHSESKDLVLGWQRNLMENLTAEGSLALPIDLAQRLVWQSAMEHVFEKKLCADITPKAESDTGSQRPDVQAIFCIDVRSEVYRRSLESTNTNIQTIG
ncbi:MAG: putative inorganic carbon transporter subunit DabA, partial [Verrucomicrobiota bacterium]|nr:putative inorganic carbon transporter subunit DabA [Verrucomicrobiota bacterium]